MCLRYIQNAKSHGQTARWPALEWAVAGKDKRSVPANHYYETGEVCQTRNGKRSKRSG